MKRIVFILFCLNMISIIPVSAAYWTDKGNYSIKWYNSSQKEFKISDAKDLAGLAYLINNNYTDFSGKTIIIDSDINLREYTWLPIGNASAPFRGTFNGNKHIISGIKIIDNTDEQYCNYFGFFGGCNTATITDLSLKGSINLILNQSYITKILGSLCAYTESSQFNNIQSYIDITYYRFNTNGFNYTNSIGGVFGQINRCNLNKISFLGDYYFECGGTGNYKSNSNFEFGGIVANASHCNFYDNYVNASFSLRLAGSVNSDNMRIGFGGIASSCVGSSFLNCHTVIQSIYIDPPSKAGDLMSNATIGGITLYTPNVIKNCYSVINKIRYKIYNTLHIGGIIGSRGQEIIWNPQNYSYNFSNNNIVFVDELENFSKPATIIREFDGNTDFSSSEMKSQEFTDELNLYFSFNDKPIEWFFDGEQYPYISLSLAGVKNVITDDNCQSNKIEYFNINGLKIDKDLINFIPGIYIVRKGNKVSKIIVK